MNFKKLITAAIGVFVTAQITDFIVHGLILKEAYELIEYVWRPDMASKMWIMYLTSAVFSFFFVYIFAKGYEGKGILEGVRYGILMGFFVNLVLDFSQYVIYEIPFILVVKWFAFGLVQFAVCGIVAAIIYKPAT